MATAYVPNIITTNAVTRFLKHIQTSNVPAKVTVAYLQTVGFKSTNDRALLPVFKAIGFIDSTGAPTDQWRLYKDTGKAKQTLANAIRKAYSGLFEIYSDANRQDNEAIANWIRTTNGASDVVVERSVRTFRVLCAEADFEGVSTDNPPVQPASIPQSIPQAAAVTLPALGGNPSININIELHLPPSDDPTVYNNLFKAMKDNLFGDK